MTATPARVPFTLLGGYLGSGKTTLLNRVLTSATGRRIVVLVNDVGAVNVDAALVVEHDGPTLALTNGCICCELVGDLAATLEEVRSLSPAADHVVMELSGVGEPARLAAWAGTTGFRLDGILVMADADQIVELAARRYVGDTVRAQLASADLVLLSKTDLASDGGAAARELVARAAPGVPVHDARAVDPIGVLGAGTGAAPGVAAVDHHQHRHVVTTVALDRPSRVELQRLVDDLPDGVVRAKGIVGCRDVESPVEVHVVGRRRSLRERTDLPASAITDVLVLIRAPDD